jgi:c(7)-type cytochrome triheme protein
MIGLTKRLQRLCRLMCGRSLTFRLRIFLIYRGCAPPRGGAPEQTGSRARWGKADTAQQTAKPSWAFADLLTESRVGAFVLVGALITLIFVTVLNSRASGSIRDSLFESPLAESNQEQMQFPEGLDYGKFVHSSRNHSRLPCLLCHRRDSNSPIPKRPGGSGHLPCAGCHAQQFSNSESPICTICHTDVKSGALKSFPRLKSFRMKFDHSLHVKMGSVSCATCHRPANAGVALSIPAGFNAHTTCYGCHTPRAQSAGRDISSCGTCHQLGGYSRTSQSASAFRVGFSHTKHEKVTCSECHQVRAGMPQRKQVTAPEPLNHHATGRGQSCMTCHDGKRAFGGDDFTVCKRCHTGATWRF